MSAFVMRILEIHDKHPDGNLGFDLRDILAALQPRAENAEWEIHHADDETFEATGVGASTLEALAGSGKRISGRSLVSLADGIHQIIWGEFRSFDHSATMPWVTVRAIDSSWYEVETADDTAAVLIRRKFKDVQLAD